MFSMMEVAMKVSGLKITRMDLVSLFMWMATDMKDNSVKEKKADREYTIMQMEIDMKVNNYNSVPKINFKT